MVEFLSQCESLPGPAVLHPGDELFFEYVDIYCGLARKVICCAGRAAGLFEGCSYAKRVSPTSEYDGISVLHYAVCWGSIPLVRELLRLAPNMVNSVMRNGWSPLDVYVCVASYCTHTRRVHAKPSQSLVGRASSVRDAEACGAKRSSSEVSIEFLAHSEKKQELVRYTVAADYNVPPPKLRPAEPLIWLLYRSAAGLNSDFVTSMQIAGADLNARNGNGRTLLLRRLSMATGTCLNAC